MEIFSNLKNSVILFYGSWWVLDINARFPYPAFNSRSLLGVYFYAPAHSYSLVQACAFALFFPVTSQNDSWPCWGEETSFFFFPGFPSCSPSLPCERPPLSGSAAWGTAVLAPGGAPNPRMFSQPLAPCSLTHPRHRVLLSTLPGFCVWGWYLLPVMPVVCSSWTGILPQQFTLEAFPQGSVELGDPPPRAGVCPSLKRGLLPKWIVLG